MKALSEIRMKFCHLLIFSIALASARPSGRAQEKASETPDSYARWDAILRATVSEDGWVDYAAIRESHAAELGAFIREIGDLRLEGMDRKAQMAFWINAYNAVCIKKILDHDLPDEVPHASFFGTNIFTEETYRVAGRVRSLDQIEHEILRKRFKDNRVHAALVCAASSCPRLRNEAYRGPKLDQQLDEECRRWIQVGRDKRGRRKNHLDRKENVLHVSKIFDWYEEDFGDSDEGIRKFVARFSNQEDATFISRHDPEIEFLPYDWHLNRK